VIDLLWETLIALAVVVVMLAATIFYADHEHAPWMLPAEMLKHVGWSLGAFGFGALYLYFALSGRRLEQEIPQLRQFLTFSGKWFVSLGISGLFFIFGVWLLWPAAWLWPLVAFQVAGRHPRQGFSVADEVARWARENNF